MYNLEKMIETGREALKRNPRYNIGSHDFRVLTSDGYDRWTRSENCYLFGIALGMRIAKAEQKKRSTRKPGNVGMVVQARVSEYVMENGIDPAELGVESGIVLSKIKGIISGSRKMTAAELEQICKALGKTPDDFMKMSE